MNKIQKLLYGCLVACGITAVTTSCSTDDDPIYLDGLRISSSYVAIPQDGGTADITITANSDWAFVSQKWISGKDTLEAVTPQWLTVSATEGAAGENTITFSAEATLDGRNCELLVESAGKTQRINIIQGLSVVSEATCAEVIAGPDSKNYRVKGTVTSIANTVYGNWYLDDGTGQIYIYGTLDKKGNDGKNNSIDDWGIEVGDVVTVEGPKTTYNGTVELVNVTVINIKKSLVKIEEGATNAFDANGGDFTVRLSVSGDGPFVSIDEEAREWLGITSMVNTDSTVNISFHVAANSDEQARNATIEFTSSNSSASSTVTATVSQMGLSGTLTNPFSVADAIAYCQTLTAATTNDFFVKGIVSKVDGAFGSYGNATFWISDDGVFNDDKTKDFEAYRVLYLGNQNWAEGHANISVGDEVLICGKLTNYNGTSETSSKAAYVYSINGVTTDDNGIGSLAYPFNIAGAMAAIDASYSGNAFVKGIISKIENNGEFGSYGNATFWISDDGAYNDDKTKDFEAYRVLYLGNRNWTEGDTQIAVSDNVILCGQLTKYGSTYETASKKAYIYSLNGVTGEEE